MVTILTNWSDPIHLKQLHTSIKWKICCYLLTTLNIEHSENDLRWCDGYLVYLANWMGQPILDKLSKWMEKKRKKIKIIIIKIRFPLAEKKPKKAKKSFHLLHSIKLNWISVLFFLFFFKLFGIIKRMYWFRSKLSWYLILNSVSDTNSIQIGDILYSVRMKSRQ